jgi:16S rRNA (uracil1498-N3)-methyltransferase
MAVPRFFVALELTPAAVGQTFALPDDAAHHAIRVVRLGTGDAVTLFTGAGGEYAATINDIGKRGASVRIEAFDAVERESPLGVTLAQAVAANDAMDLAVRKATELGAAAIQPLVTQRSAPLPAGERRDKRLAHWQQIAVAACEQCGRNRVPEIFAVVALADWLGTWRGGGVALAPGGEQSLAMLPMAPSALLVGPEGGLAPGEIAAARAAGFVTARLGPRVLRTETAGMAALAALNVLWGDLR